MTIHKSIAVFSGLMLAGPALAAEMTDDQVRDAIVHESVSAYSGSCPCPYNNDAAGRTCGARSAHSKAGGARVICFAHEVSDDMVEKFRQRHTH